MREKVLQERKKSEERTRGIDELEGDLLEGTTRGVLEEGLPEGDDTLDGSGAGTLRTKQCESVSRHTPPKATRWRTLIKMKSFLTIP